LKELDQTFKRIFFILYYLYNIFFIYIFEINYTKFILNNIRGIFIYIYILYVQLISGEKLRVYFFLNKTISIY
jgi:hypothetical protein